MKKLLILILLFSLTGCSQPNLGVVEEKEVQVLINIEDDGFYDYFDCEGEEIRVTSNEIEYNKLLEKDAKPKKRDGCKWKNSSGKVKTVTKQIPELLEGQYAIVEETSTTTTKIIKSGEDYLIIEEIK